MSRMEVTYALTRQDVLAFTQFHARKTNKARWLGALVNVFFGAVWAFQLIFVLRLFYAWRHVFMYFPSVWRYIFHAHQHTLLLFAFSTLYLAYLFWGQKWLAARALPSDALLSRPRTVRLTPEGVRVVSEHEDALRAWGDMTDVDADPRYVFLYTTPTNALVVPKAAFGSAGQAQAFEGQARAFLADPRLREMGNAQEGNAGVWPPPPSYAAVQPAAAPADPLDTPAPGQMEAAYRTRPADLWRAQGRILRRQPAALLPLLVPYAAGAFAWTWVSRRMDVATALWISGGVALVLCLVTVAWLTHKAIKKQFAGFGDGRPGRTIVRPDVLIDITPMGRTMLRWPDVQSVTVQGGDVVFRTAAGGVFVPRSAFGSERERAAFVEAARGFLQAARA